MFDDGVDPRLQLQRLDDAERARLTTLLVDSRNQSGNDRAEVTPELIERARRSPPLSVDERAERLLKFVAKESVTIGDSVNLISERAPTSDTDGRAMAWSESTTLSEVEFLVGYLIDQGWIHRQGGVVDDVNFTVTVDGYRRIVRDKDQRRVGASVRSAVVR